MTGLIETFLAAGGRAPFFEQSWRRLSSSAKKIGIPISKNLKRQILARLKRAAPGRKNYRARVALTPEGKIEVGANRIEAEWITSAKPGACRLLAMPAPRGYPGRWQNLKTTDRRGLERAYSKAARAGADDALLLLPGHRPVETSRANFFWIRNGALYTPPLSDGCLAGLVRAWVIRTARRIGVSVKESPTPMRALKSAAGAFRTNAVIGLEWVSEIRGPKGPYIIWREPPPLAVTLHRRLARVFRSFQ